jgi:hypothetical protein
MSVGFGLAAIRACRERGHRDGRCQARRRYLFQPRLRDGRREHRAVEVPRSGHPQRLVGSSCFSISRKPCWPGGRLPSPSRKRTSTTVKASVPIRFSERPPGLRRIFSPFTRPLSDYACILYLCGIVTYPGCLAVGCYEMNGLMFILHEPMIALRISVHLSLCIASGAWSASG